MPWVQDEGGATRCYLPSIRNRYASVQVCEEFGQKVRPSVLRPMKPQTVKSRNVRSL
jgi:hypothetical protein